jgi:hypothetical protein
MGRGFWGAREQIVLRSYAIFARGQDITFDIAVEAPPHSFWYWATEGAERPLMPTGTINCRLVFIADGQDEEEFYFISLSRNTNGRERPILVGQHLFNYRDEWQAED